MATLIASSTHTRVAMPCWSRYDPAGWEGGTSPGSGSGTGGSVTESGYPAGDDGDDFRENVLLSPALHLESVIGALEPMERGRRELLHSLVEEVPARERVARA